MLKNRIFNITVIAKETIQIRERKDSINWTSFVESNHFDFDNSEIVDFEWFGKTFLSYYY